MGMMNIEDISTDQEEGSEDKTEVKEAIAADEKEKVKDKKKNKKEERDKEEKY